MNYIEVFAERESANDESYNLIELLVSNGDKIKEGALIALLEGSKAVIEIASPSSGYIFLLEETGAIIEVGSPYAIVSKESTFNVKLYKKNSKLESISSKAKIENSDITKKFTAKAHTALGENEVDNNYFSKMEIVTETDVLLYLKYKKQSMVLKGGGDEINIDVAMETHIDGITEIQRIAVIGSGSAAVLAYDAVSKRQNQTIACFFDNYKSTDFSLAGIKVIGLASVKNIYSEYKKGTFDAVVISPGLLPFRKELFIELVEIGVPFTNIIHPSVEIGVNVEIGTGNVIFGGTMIGPSSKIGNNNFIATRCNFEHHNLIMDHNTFGPSVTTSGSVSIGSSVIFGSGIFIEPKIKIGDNSTISSGSIIQKDVPDDVIVKTKITSVTKKK